MKTFYTKFSSLLFLLFICSATSIAQTYVNQAATGMNNGSSWANAYTDLSTALSNTTSGEVWIATGTYLPGAAGTADSSFTFRVSNPLSIYGGFAGTETSVDDRDITTNPTTLSGDILGDDITNDFTMNKTDNVQHVVVVDSLLTGLVSFDGLNIIGGNTSNNGDLDIYFRAGGGIFSFSTISVNDCGFRNNFARTGAGIYITSATGGGNDSSISGSTFEDSSTGSQSAGIMLSGIENVTITDCDFMNNQTIRGAFYPLRCNNISVSNCNFDNNTGSPTGFGGALFNWNTTGLSFTDCTFTNNTCGNGGVMYNDYREITVLNPADLIFENCTFENNEAFDFGGGTIYSWLTSMTVNNCSFSSNIATNGSHIFMAGNKKDVIISNSTFNAGASTFGGAHNCYGDSSTYLLQNNTYTGCIATTSGGAVIIGFKAVVNLDSCTFVGNSADFGGAISMQNDSTAATFNKCSFETNMAMNNGGVINHGSGVGATYDKCTFELNTSNDVGGVLHITNDGVGAYPTSATVSNSVFNFNSAVTQGGAINLNNSDVSISNTILTNNNVTTDGVSGGAISMNAGDSSLMTLNIINSTLAGNDAPIGSGISQFTTALDSDCILNIQNCMLFNTGDNYAVEDGTPVAVSTGGNISGDATTDGVFTDASDQHSVADPGFLNSGAFDFRITAESPAIDAGIDMGAPTTDINGLPRIGVTDSGAHEFDPSTNVNTIIVDNSALSILPNPVNKNLSFELLNDWAGKLQLSIYSSNGQLVKQWTETKNNNLLRESMSVKKLSQGSYRLMIQFENKLVTQQFVKL